jgi:DNA processing protein
MLLPIVTNNHQFITVKEDRMSVSDSLVVPHVLTTPSNDIQESLALFHLPGVGPTRYHKLIEWFGSAAAVISGDRKLIQAAGVKAGSIKQLDDYARSGLNSWLGERVTRDLEWRSQAGNDVLLIDDEDYPALLKHIHNPPPILFIRGCRERINDPQLAMVGSRNPSIDGKENAYRFAKALVNVGLTVTSGMAMGVDASAHQGAIDGRGYTVAVVGTGADIIYPARHRGLAEKILEQGVIVSEFPLGTQPQPANFPRRNRIISALSLGVLVVEASPRSGSLITAHCALEQGREVYAIPGSIHNPMARGCHQLIKQGAKLIESSEDIFEELSSLLAFHQFSKNEPKCVPSEQQRAIPLSGDLFGDSEFPDNSHRACTDDGNGETVVDLTEPEKSLLMQIGFDVVSVDSVVERLELPVEDISFLLMSLELKGIVQSVPGGFQRIGKSRPA